MIQNNNMMEVEEKVLKPKTMKETSKTRDIISKLRDNPQRLQNLKESLKYFSLLKRNHYLERRRHKPTLDDVLICNCLKQSDDPSKSINCGDRCLNRYTCTECDVELCPCGEQCKNRRFQKHEDACIYPFRCGGKGWGLAAGEKICKGQFIMQYIGEIFQTQSTLGRRRTQEYAKSTCTYLMKINNQEVIDPTYKGNLARFINHSCEPNCITVKWNVLGEVCIGIFANRDINEDEELTFDYQFDAYNTPLTKCLCGVPNCKGYLGLKPTNITQEKWEEHLETMLCKICEVKTAQDDDKLLLCDKCNCGFHMFCLKPPLENVPKDSWYCTQCLEELQDEKEQERIKLEEQELAQRKIKTITQERKKKGPKKGKKIESESSSSESSNENDEYDQRFKTFKELEKQATLELLKVNQPEDVQIETDLIRKKSTVKITPEAAQPKPPKQIQLQGIVEEAQSRFQKLYGTKTDLQDKVTQLANQTFQDMQKDCIKVNIIEQKLVRMNAPLMYQLGNRISFDTLANQEHVDYFRKENDLTVIGSSTQIQIFMEVFSLMETIVKELKKEMGIVEGQLKIPALFLKRVVLTLSQLEQRHHVNILYSKQAAHMEEIFPLDRMTPLKIKGSQANIERCVEEITTYIRQLTVYRLYISRSETKTVQQNMFNLKQTTQAEIRISRDSVYRGEHLQRDINHPFFYIQFREKEVCLIGTEKQIQETSQAINTLLQQERAKDSDKEVTYFTVLINTQYKDTCKQVKLQMEKQSSSTKVLLFEASHPRKNLTILVLCLRSQLTQVREKFNEAIRLSNDKIQLESFQDQMSMQMCRYVFKYLQNTLMTDEMAFMKNWDLITPYFFNFTAMKKEDENWFAKRCINYQLLRDFETQLYIQYILGNKISQSMQEPERIQRRRNVITLLKKILNGLINSKKNNHFDEMPMLRGPDRDDENSQEHSLTYQQESCQDFLLKLGEEIQNNVAPQPQMIQPPILRPQQVKSSSDDSSSNDSESQSDGRSSSESSHRHRRKKAPRYRQKRKHKRPQGTRKHSSSRSRSRYKKHYKYR